MIFCFISECPSRSADWIKLTLANFFLFPLNHLDIFFRSLKAKNCQKKKTKCSLKGFYCCCFFFITSVSVILKNWNVFDTVVRVIDLESFDHCHFGIKFRQGLWILSCEEAINLVNRMFVVLLGCPLVPEIMHKGAPLPPPAKAGM